MDNITINLPAWIVYLGVAVMILSILNSVLSIYLEHLKHKIDKEKFVGRR